MQGARTAARAPLADALALLLLSRLLPLLLLPGAAATTQAPDTLAAIGAILPPFVSDNFDELVKAAAATCEVIPQQLLFSRIRLFDIHRIQLVKFSQRSRRAYSVHSAHKLLHTSEPLVLYVPGWWNTPTDASSTAIVKALMTKHSTVYVLDTRQCFCRGYVAAVSNIVLLSETLFSFIKNLHKTGYPMSSIHLIGFSLGAHVAGLTGKLVKRNLNSTLGRITALDPARPCFARTENRLDKQDAKFVHVIHSSTGVLGLEEPVGHADVYVNGVAARHPECQKRSISLECDHAQAWKLYSASAVNEKTLMGRRCASWKELLQNECSGNETVLGYSCSTENQGMFLYKSQEKTQPRDLQVFNLFDLLQWPLRIWQR